MEEDPYDVVRTLAALAQVPLSDERIAALALALPRIRAALHSLAAVEYGEVEPACRFRPPQETQR